MEITAAMVKALRERSGAGIMDCKKALLDCDGDQELAIDALRKKGAEMADAKSARTASDGIIVSAVSDDGTVGALVEVNCETDFVARGDVFRGFALPLGELALTISDECRDVSVLSAMTMENGETVETARRAIVAKVGENVAVRRMSVIKSSQGARIESYNHNGKIGVLVELSGGSDELGSDLAMHVAAMRPKWVSADRVPYEVLSKEREIYAEQAAQTGKPEFVIERIIEGRLRKFTEEHTLYGQDFVKDQEHSVEKLLKSKQASVDRFRRLELGEDAG